MKLLPLTPVTIKRAITLLKKGGIIAHPADTCFGLAGDVANPKAVERILEIKGRNDQKPMSIMLPMSLIQKLADYAQLDDFASRIAKKLLPGPVTILLPKGPMIPKFYFPETDLIGIRIPDDAFTQMLLEKFKGPLITTSANRAGKPLTLTSEAVIKEFQNAPADPDFVFEGAIKEGSLASTILMPKDGKLQIVRQGPMSAEKLQALCDCPVIS